MDNSLRLQRLTALSPKYLRVEAKLSVVDADIVAIVVAAVAQKPLI
eukprot:gene2565-5484_t